MAHQEEIIPVVTSNIIGSDLSDRDISVVEIPNDFTLFNADVTQIKDSEKPFLTVKDVVIAQYDADKMPDSAGANRFLSKYMGFGTLYQEDKIVQAVKNSGLTGNVSDYANVFDNIKSYQKQVDDDMTRSSIVAIALFILEIYVLYTFLSLRLSIVSRKLTILQFLGQSNSLTVSKQVIPLILGSLLALCIAYVKGANMNIIALLSCVYLLLIVGLTSVILMKIRRTRIQILKGEEILL